ncbi:MAG: SGNH/GDSL hydrolase family protein, partial [Coprothermobacterota bacterium]|nr:SGNH/GDSL hydrolase family protein [Coprothermobacterota bacterium]
MNYFLALLGVVVVSIALYVWYRIDNTFIRHPKSYPTPAYLQRMQSKYPAALRIVCLGDSITQGDLGASYMSLLEKRSKSPASLVIMNAGINSDLSSNLLSRLDDVIAVQPSIITILIGTNDVHAGMSSQNCEAYVRMGKIKQPPSFETYKENIAEMLKRLQSATSARIALVSIPLISENIEHEVNKRGDIYSDYLREVADQLKVDYLPLRETQKTFLETTANKGGQPYKNTNRLVGLAFVYALLGMNWDKIADLHGNRLSIDNIHCNSQAANMIADLISGFIQKNTAQ